MFQEHALLQAHNVKVVGSGNKYVVLAHGFGSDQSLWQLVLPSLVDTYRVVLLDLACAGTANPDNFNTTIYESYYEFADDLLVALEELNIYKCSYVGHSMSGMIGCIASIKKPQLFERLVLLCASPRYLNHADYYGGFEREDVDELYDAIKSDFKSWVPRFARMAVGVDRDDAIEQFSNILRRMRPDIALVLARTIFESDFRSILPQVNAPCCVLQTYKDGAVPLVVADYLRRNLGGTTTLEIIHAEGHFPQLTAPNELVPVLKRALNVRLVGRERSWVSNFCSYSLQILTALVVVGVSVIWTTTY